MDGFAIGQIVASIDAIDEDYARLGVIVGGTGDAIEQRAGAQGAEHAATEAEIPVGIAGDGFHERVGRQHRKIEIAQAAGLTLGGDEILDIRVVAAHSRHHRTAPRTGGHDGAAHRIPNIHEGERAGGIRPHAAHGGTLGPQRGEIVADPAALLHGECRLAQIVENAAEIVADIAHDEAVEQGHFPVGAGAGKDAASRQEAEILQRRVEGRPSQFTGCFSTAARARATRAQLSSMLRSTGVPSAAFRRYLALPDLAGDRARSRAMAESCRDSVLISMLSLYPIRGKEKRGNHAQSGAKNLCVLDIRCPNRTATAIKKSFASFLQRRSLFSFVRRQASEQ